MHRLLLPRQAEWDKRRDKEMTALDRLRRGKRRPEDDAHAAILMSLRENRRDEKEEAEYVAALPKWRREAKKRVETRWLEHSFWDKEEPNIHLFDWGRDLCSPFKWSSFSDDYLFPPATVHQAYLIFMDWRALKMEEDKDEEMFREIHELRYYSVLAEIEHHERWERD